VNILSDVKQITCILPKGKSAAVQKSLIDDHGIYSANFHYARGIGKFSSGRGFGEQREKEILEVMVSPDIADEIFERLIDIHKNSDISLMLVEQRVAEALHFASRAYVLEAGRIILSGDQETLRDDDRIRQAYLGM